MNDDVYNLIGKLSGPRLLKLFESLFRPRRSKDHPYVHPYVLWRKGNIDMSRDHRKFRWSADEVLKEMAKDGNTGICITPRDFSLVGMRASAVGIYMRHMEQAFGCSPISVASRGNGLHDYMFFVKDVDLVKGNARINVPYDEFFTDISIYATQLMHLTSWRSQMIDVCRQVAGNKEPSYIRHEDLNNMMDKYVRDPLDDLIRNVKENSKVLRND